MTSAHRAGPGSPAEATRLPSGTWVSLANLLGYHRRRFQAVWGSRAKGRRVTHSDMREMISPAPLPACEILVCVYTCARHSALLDEFHRSAVGQHLKQLPAGQVLEVTADPGIGRSYHQGSSLTVAVPESYETLSLKTYEMIRYCYAQFDFHRLLKIDVTTVQAKFDSPDYAGRSPVDGAKLLKFLKESPADRDYDGFRFHARASRQNVEAWAAKKQGRIDYERLFGSGPVAPYFTGKAYFISRGFAGFISRHGNEMAEEHVRYLLGSEDVMIGRLYQQFSQGHS